MCLIVTPTLTLETTVVMVHIISFQPIKDLRAGKAGRGRGEVTQELLAN